MTNPKKKPPLVVVTWEDATMLDEGAWADTDTEHEYKAKIFEQVGFLLHDGPEGVILTHAWHEETIAAREQIPRGMIRRVRKLKA